MIDLILRDDIFLQNWSDLLNDGLHFSESGGEFVYKLVMPWINERTNHLTTRFPLWDQIDPENPENALLPSNGQTSNDNL